MIYVLKFAYSFLLPPGLFILGLVLLSLWLFFRKKQRTSAIAAACAAVVLYTASVPFAGDLLVSSLEQKYKPPVSIDGDVYVVLTGGAIAGTPQPGGNGNVSGSTLQRLVTALELYKTKPLPILISGGTVYKHTGNEGQLARRTLMMMGVPDKDILLDDQSRTTQENAAKSKLLLEQGGFQKPVLITSAFHMARSVRHFEAQQVTVKPYPTDYRVSPIPLSWTEQWSPSAGAMDKLAMALKEYIGLLQ